MHRAGRMAGGGIRPLRGIVHIELNGIVHPCMGAWLPFRSKRSQGSPSSPGDPLLLGPAAAGRA